MTSEQSGRFKVTVGRNRLRFAAAHFTTIGEDCEPLHGHNYDVFVEVEGSLTDDAWVVDFIKLKQIAASLCKELDHRFLLALQSPHLQIGELGEAYEIKSKGRRYVIPKSDVAPLPIDNSTAERLAQLLCRRLLEELKALGANNLSAVTVGVEEAPGQAGWCRLPVGS